jgi:hypothetical protein
MASEFDIYRQDLQALACERTLEVFRRSVVIRGIQTAQVQEAQQLHDALIDSLQARTLNFATGANLDVLGRIVGMFPRPLQDAGAITYFSTDLPLAAPDWAPVYVIGAPLAGQVQIGDPDYLVAIRAKIAKNHTKYGSAPEIQYFANLAYGVTLSVKNIGLGDLEIVFSASTPPSVIAAAIADFSDDTADHQFNLPLPTTSRIKRVSFRYPDAFAPDLNNGAPDVALVGVGYVLNA